MAAVSNLLVSIRNKIHDVKKIEYEDAELIDCLNDAIDYMSLFLIRIADGEMIKSIIVPGMIEKPSDFDSVVGAQSLYMENNYIKTLTGDPATMRYYATKQHISDTTDAIPFKSSLEPLLAELTAIYALNRNEYDITQDMALFEKKLAIMQGGGS